MTVSETERDSSAERSGPFQFRLRTLLLAFPVVAWCVVTGIRGTALAAFVLTTAFLLMKRKSGLAFGFVIPLFLLLSCLGLGSSVEFRLDTGDKRFVFWGIPVSHRSLRAEQRDANLSLSDAEVPRRWVWCARQVGTNDPDAMVSAFYRDAAAWVDVDPEIAKLVRRDIADYLQTTHAARGSPECFVMLWPTVVEREETGSHVVQDWQKNPDVQAYLARKGYVPHVNTAEQ